jgi:aminoglycoside 3-N-acetyltransferase
MEENIISKTIEPNTEKTIYNDLIKLGIRKGMTILVHSSLSSIGWICGGPVAVIYALEKAISKNGTLVMPTHSSDYTDPEHWENPPVPKSWISTIKDEMPIFDPRITPTRNMGKIPETFRKQNGVARSKHPNASFAAWGKNKTVIIKKQNYDYCMDINSPLGEVYKRNGYILLIGVGYNKNTSFHLAEYMSTNSKKVFVNDGFPLIKNGKRIWNKSKDILFDDSDFEQIGNEYEKYKNLEIGKIGNAETRLINQRDLVYFAVKWMNEHRK